MRVSLPGFAPEWKYQVSLIGQSLSEGMNFFRLSNVGICSLSPCSAHEPRGARANGFAPWREWPARTRLLRVIRADGLPLHQTRAPAIVWAGAIARLGSLSLDTLSYAPSDNLWQLSGTLYAAN